MNTYGYVPKSIIFNHQPLIYFIDLWNEQPTEGFAYNNVTCNPVPRQDMNNLFANDSNQIIMFLCGTDIDNNFIGAVYQESHTFFMYARSTGFVGWNQTDRGATIMRVQERAPCNATAPDVSLRIEQFLDYDTLTVVSFHNITSHST